MTVLDPPDSVVRSTGNLCPFVYIFSCLSFLHEITWNAKEQKKWKTLSNWRILTTYVYFAIREPSERVEDLETTFLLLQKVWKLARSRKEAASEDPSKAEKRQYRGCQHRLLSRSSAHCYARSLGQGALLVVRTCNFQQIPRSRGIEIVSSSRASLAPSMLIRFCQLSAFSIFVLFQSLKSVDQWNALHIPFFPSFFLIYIYIDRKYLKSLVESG